MEDSLRVFHAFKQVCRVIDITYVTELLPIFQVDVNILKTS